MSNSNSNSTANSTDQSPTANDTGASLPSLDVLRDQIRRRSRQRAGDTDPVTRADLRASDQRRKRLKNRLQAITPGYSQFRVYLTDGVETAFIIQALDPPLVVITAREIPQHVTDFPDVVWDRTAQFGLAIHESGHYLFTPDDYVTEQLDDVPRQFRDAAKDLWNTFEDGAIETFLKVRLDSAYERAQASTTDAVEAAAENPRGLTSVTHILEVLRENFAREGSYSQSASDILNELDSDDIRSGIPDPAGDTDDASSAANSTADAADDDEDAPTAIESALHTHNTDVVSIFQSLTQAESDLAEPDADPRADPGLTDDGETLPTAGAESALTMPADVSDDPEALFDALVESNDSPDTAGTMTPEDLHSVRVFHFATAVPFAAHELAVHPTGDLAKLLDPDDHRHIFRTPAERERFIEFFPTIVETAIDVQTTLDPEARTDLIFDFWDEYQAILEDMGDDNQQDALDEMESASRAMSDDTSSPDMDRMPDDIQSAVDAAQSASSGGQQAQPSTSRDASTGAADSTPQPSAGGDAALDPDAVDDDDFTPDADELTASVSADTGIDLDDDQDADADADADADGDTEADADTEAPAGSEPGAGGATDTGTDSDADADTTGESSSAEPAEAAGTQTDDAADQAGDAGATQSTGAADADGEPDTGQPDATDAQDATDTPGDGDSDGAGAGAGAGASDASDQTPDVDADATTDTAADASPPGDADTTPPDSDTSSGPGADADTDAEANAGPETGSGSDSGASSQPDASSSSDLSPGGTGQQTWDDFLGGDDTGADTSSDSGADASADDSDAGTDSAATGDTAPETTSPDADGSDTSDTSDTAAPATGDGSTDGDSDDADDDTSDQSSGDSTQGPMADDSPGGDAASQQSPDTPEGDASDTTDDAGATPDGDGAESKSSSMPDLNDGQSAADTTSESPAADDDSPANDSGHEGASEPDAPANQADGEQPSPLDGDTSDEIGESQRPGQETDTTEAGTDADTTGEASSDTEQTPSRASDASGDGAGGTANPDTTSDSDDAHADADADGSDDPFEVTDTDAGRDVEASPEAAQDLMQDLLAEAQDITETQSEAAEEHQQVEDALESSVKDITGRGSHQLDDVKTMVPTGACTPPGWNAAAGQSQALKETIRQTFELEERGAWESQQRHGSQIDDHEIGSLPAGNLNVLEEFSEGEEKDYAVVVVLDRSASMSGARIKAAEEAVAAYVQALEDDPVNIDVCVIDFYGNEGRVISPFSTPTRESAELVMTQETSGSTPLTGALQLGETYLQQRGRGEKELMFMVTDDQPNDTEAYREALRQCYADVIGILLQTNKQSTTGMDPEQADLYDYHTVVINSSEVYRKLDNMTRRLLV